MPHELAELENKSENDQPLIVLDWSLAHYSRERLSQYKFEQTSDFNRNTNSILAFKKTYMRKHNKFARPSTPFVMTQVK